MNKLRILLLMGFALATASLYLGAGQARAASSVSAINGNFRDPDTVVVKQRKITRAQREAAAKRLAVSRAAVRKKGTISKTAVPNPASPPDEKGGANK
jgi:hypothetical protein